MSSIETLVQRANRLARQTSDTGLEEEWELLCSTAQTSLLTELEFQIASEAAEGEEKEADDLPFLDEPWVAEFNAFLEEQEPVIKRQYFKNRGRRRRGGR